jgi:hypothetical protein
MDFIDARDFLTGHAVNKDDEFVLTVDFDPGNCLAFRFSSTQYNPAAAAAGCRCRARISYHRLHSLQGSSSSTEKPQALS